MYTCNHNLCLTVVTPQAQAEAREAEAQKQNLENSK